MKLASIIAAVSILCISCGPGVPVDVKLKKSLRWVVIEVKAVANEVTIEDILINKGECQIPADYEKKTLKRSQTDSLSAFGCNEVRQVTVVTNMGRYDFNF